MMFISYLMYVCSSNVDPITKLYVIGNEYRLKNNLKPYVRNHELERAAKLQADHCASVKKPCHDQPGPTPSPYERIKRYGYEPMVWAENAAETIKDDPSHCLENWIKSSGHKRNLLLPSCDDVGYAVCKGANSKTYWVGVYGRKSPSSQHS